MFDCITYELTWFQFSFLLILGISFNCYFKNRNFMLNILIAISFKGNKLLYWFFFPKTLLPDVSTCDYWYSLFSHRFLISLLNNISVFKQFHESLVRSTRNNCYQPMDSSHPTSRHFKLLKLGINLHWTNPIDSERGYRTTKTTSAFIPPKFWIVFQK